jgi:ferredoxin
MYYKILTLLKIIIVTSAFVSQNKSQIPLTLQKGIFENAFKNKSFENKPDSSGISQKKTVPVKIGSITVQALPNQRIKDVVRAVNAPIKFNCENGKCGTCECKVDGRIARICTMYVPARGCTITRK